MPADAPARRVLVLDVLAFVLELVAFAVLAVWGFARFPVPVNVVVGIVAPLVAIALWALFRSPRAVLRADAYVKALVQIVVMGAAVFAFVDLGAWIVGLVFAVLAVAVGLVTGRREIR